jgi:hypothetical protein
VSPAEFGFGCRWGSGCRRNFRDVRASVGISGVVEIFRPALGYARGKYFLLRSDNRRTL